MRWTLWGGPRSPSPLLSTTIISHQPPLLSLCYYPPPPTPTPLLPSLLPTPIPSYPLHTPLLSLAIYLSVKGERERERERARVDEGGGPPTAVSYCSRWMHCTDHTHNTSAVPPSLPDCRIPAPPPFTTTFVHTVTWDAECGS